MSLTRMRRTCYTSENKINSVYSAIWERGLSMRNVNGHAVMLQAHRGVSTDCPENTMAAFSAAVEQGYDVIELDPKFTRDNRCVVLHDRTINRTARGGSLSENVQINDITLDEARAYEYGSWFAPEFAGEGMPLLEDALLFAKAHAIPLKIDNVIESFTAKQTEILFDLVENTGTQSLAGFTCTRADFVAAVADRFPKSTIHYDGPAVAERLNAVRGILKENPLVVWLPYPNRLTSWCTAPAASEERVKLVRDMGARLGVWILEDEADLIDVCARFSPDIVETTGSLKPDKHNG